MADDVQKLIAQVEARYAKAEKEMSKFVGVVNKKMKEADDATKKASKQMEAQVAKAFNSMTSSVKTFIGAIAGVAAIRGFSAMTTGALKAAASIDVVGKSTNTTLRGLQELRYLATQAGADIAVMDDALKTLNVGLGEFRNEGGGPAVAVLKALGLESRVLAGEFETTDEAFIAILNRLREVPHAADRASMAAKLFGEEAGSKMGRLLDSTAVSIDEARKEANRLGLVLSDDMVRKAGEADAALSTLWQTIQMAGVRAIVENADAIRDLARAFADAMPGILDDLRAYAEWMGVIERTPMRAAQAQVDGLAASVEGLKKHKASAENGSIFQSLFGNSPEEYDTLIKAEEGRLAFAREVLKIQQALGKFAADGGRGDLPASAAGKPRLQQGLFAPDAESAKRLADEAAKARQKLDEWDQARLNWRTGSDRYDIRREQMDAMEGGSERGTEALERGELARLTVDFESVQRARDEFRYVFRDFADSIASGDIKGAFEGLMADITDRIASRAYDYLADQLFDLVGGDLMADLFDPAQAAQAALATTTTQTSGSMQLASVAANTLATALYNAAAAAAAQGAAGGASGLLGLLGRSGAGSGAASAGFKLAMRANGGPVVKGRPYVVGERRPELFVPNTSGRIIPEVPSPVAGGGAMTFAPVINAQGAGPSEVAALKQALAQSQAQFERFAAGERGRVQTYVSDGNTRRQINRGG